ncbi:MAG: DUF2207 domain-containing protein [Terriglobales bacterium]
MRRIWGVFESNRNRLRRGLLLALLVLVCALPAAARSWRISNFRTTASIGGDGSAAILEDISLVFVGEYHGIHRTIPVEYPGPRGTNYTLFLKITGVTDGNNNPLKYETKRQGAYLDIKIYIPSATNTNAEVQISYITPNALRYFGDYDEFYWNVTGNDWPVPIEHAAATVLLPPAASGGLRAQAFTGIYGSKDKEASVQIKDATAEFETTNPLPMRGGLTIDVAIPKGVIKKPGALTQFGWFVRSNPILLLPLLALAVMFPLWWYRGKDPDPGLSIAPMYEPPANMSPAETGTLIDDEVNPRDITSTVIDLAVRGYLKIEETEEKHFLFSQKDYIFHLLRPMTEWKDLRPHERVLLQNVFQGGQTTRMSSLKNRFYTAIPMIKDDVIRQLKQKGMYTVDPGSAAKYVIGGAVLIGAPFLLLQWFGLVNFFESTAMAVAGIGLAALIVILFGRKMSATSMLGARTRVQVLGFQEFMNRVDADRLKRMPPDTFEKYLPFAMALGVEHHWAAAFAGLITQPPTWYVSPNGMGYFNPMAFSNNIHAMATNLHSVMVSAPRSSSSGSGFGGGGGGGFSGGGFGGGGGGAF